MQLRQHSQIEQKDNIKIEKTRREHAERLKRIMNEKYMEKGLDYDALQHQADEKRAREAREREEEAAYQRRFLEEQRLLAKLATEEKKQIKEIELETIEFRKNYQRPEMSREYDITRKDLRKIAPPARVGENDPWISVSSGQKFEGEDSSNQERLKAQREQLERWQLQQIAEMKNRKAKEAEDNLEWERKYLEADKISVEVGQQEGLIRKQWKHEITKENQMLAMEKREREAAERNRELQYNEYEIETVNSSPFLNEVGVEFSPHRGHNVTQDFKHMSEKEFINIKNTQLAQITEANRIKAEKEREEREKNEAIKIASRNAIKQTRALERERKERERQLAMENIELAKRKEEDKIKPQDPNVPSDEFWAFFGASHR